MHITNILEETAILMLLSEMSARELDVITLGLQKDARPLGLKVVPTHHFANERLLDSNDPKRADIEAADLYKTVREFLHKMQGRIRKYAQQKQDVEFLITNRRTNLNVAVALKFGKEPRNTSTPYDVNLITAIIEPDFKTKNNLDNQRIFVNV